MAAITRLLLGPDFGVNGTSSVSFNTFALDGSTDLWECIVQAETSGAITHVGFRYGARTGTPPTYRISIQGVDGAGIPDGTIKGGASPASATFTPPADATWDATWQWVALANSYTPATVGERLALVIDYSSGTINGTNFSSFTVTSDHFSRRQGFPYVIQNAAGVRTRQSDTPIYGYKDAGATYGHPLETVNATLFSSDSTPDEYALQFTLPAALGDTFKLLGVQAMLRTPAAAKTFKVTLYEGTTEKESFTCDSDQQVVAASTGRLVEILWDDTPVTLTCGTTYYIGFQPQETASSLGLYTAVADSAAEAVAWGGDGTWGLATRTDAGAWSSDLAQRPFVALLFADITEPAGGSGGEGGLVRFNAGFN